MNLEQEAQRLLNLISTVSSDIHRMPRDNLDHMLETLNVSSKEIFGVEHFDKNSPVS